MATAALKLVADERRRAAAHLLIRLHIKNAGLFADIDRLKDELRHCAEVTGEGFVERFDDGLVQVSAGSEGGKFKGLMPELDAAKVMTLPAGKLKKLVDDGIIAMVKQFTKASRPSVTVKL